MPWRSNQKVPWLARVTLGKFFGMEPQFWMNPQSNYEVEIVDYH